MSRPEEYTLTPKEVIELARELLTARGAPVHIGLMSGLDREQFGTGDMWFRRVDVIAWCRERQSKSIRYAFAVVAEVERVLEVKKRDLDGHDYSNLQDIHIAAIDLLSDLLDAGKAAEGP